MSKRRASSQEIYTPILCWDVKRLIINQLRHESPILILLNKDWHEFICAQDWNQLLHDWHTSKLVEGVLAEGSLALRNGHPRDKHITFIGGAAHKYTITEWDGARFIITTPRPKHHPRFMSGLLSVTTFVHHLFPEFDKVDALAKGRRGRNKKKYEGKTDEEVFQEWEDNRVTSSNEGTLMHENIENYYNGLPHHVDTKEFTLFMRYQNELDKEGRLRAWRTEMMVYDLPLMLVGSIDKIYEFVDPSEQFTPCGKKRLVVADWKRSKEIKRNNRWQKGCTTLTAGMDDCNFQHYTMQLNIYKLILERQYNVSVVEMYLVILHPNQDDFEKIPVTMTNQERARIVQFRRRQCG